MIKLPGNRYTRLPNTGGNKLNRIRATVPSYMKIAIDIAHSISDGQYREGDLLHIRTALVGKYGVSAETVRRAINILGDVGVVDIRKNFGVYVLSEKKALQFMLDMGDFGTLTSLVDSLQKKMKAAIDNITSMQDTLIDLTTRIGHYSKLSSISPRKLQLSSACLYLGKTIADIQLWQHTGATIIAIQHGNGLTLSPGPSYRFVIDDILYYVESPDKKECIVSYLGLASPTEGTDSQS